jgi:hypothetical protein
MVASQKKVRRSLHFKFTLPTADSAQLFAMMKNIPSYQTIFGEVQVRFLQNADNPARVIQIVDYEMPESIESSRQSLASDPRVQAYLQAWRSMVPDVQMDVYREIEG